MMRVISLLVVSLFLGVGATAEKEKSDKEIKKELIRQSIASYSGSCPCPYNTDRGGRRCGKRSAYSRPGGASPLCYEGDVSKEIVDAYRERQKNGKASRETVASRGRNSRVAADVVLSITSEPSLAEVYINGSFNGLTPRKKVVQPGEYSAEVRKSGFQSWLQIVNVADEATEVHAALVK